MPPLGAEGAQGGAGRVPGAEQRLGLVAPPHGAVAAIQEAVRQLGRQLGGELPGQVVLWGHQARRVVHFNLQVGQRVQQRRIGHGDFVGHVVQGVDGPAVHGGRRGQVRGRRQQVGCRQEVTLESGVMPARSRHSLLNCEIQ